MRETKIHPKASVHNKVHPKINETHLEEINIKTQRKSTEILHLIWRKKFSWFSLIFGEQINNRYTERKKKKIMLRKLTLNIADMKNKGSINSANPHKIICVLSSVNADESLCHCIK